MHRQQINRHLRFFRPQIDFITRKYEHIWAEYTLRHHYDLRFTIPLGLHLGPASVWHRPWGCIFVFARKQLFFGEADGSRTKIRASLYSSYRAMIRLPHTTTTNVYYTPQGRCFHARHLHGWDNGVGAKTVGVRNISPRAFRRRDVRYWRPLFGC